MVKSLIEITNETGLHARPASEFVKVAKNYKSDVFLQKEDKKINAKSILGILALCLNKGSKAEIIVDGEDEGMAMEALTDLINNMVE
ncbi:phosphocarrier protein HPr [Vallitalea longa]|uniref:Phosphocarrier protein HPr n=1 Tax=Vallitalea longa TaxID=2936439 RepID=A0A9W5YER4_9FIRM|nr:HPr family phosphocarrier protein [Vallitalea longa]GKX29863.1 phosphocarrier protein HPr [Vallitalea longa]